MVRKNAPHERAKKGIIPTDDPSKDRARTVHTLFTKFKYRLNTDEKIFSQMVDKSREILEIGDSDRLFDGRDPYVSGVAVFVVVCRHFSDDHKCPITYNEIRESGHFASGKNFVSLLETLTKKFNV